VAIDVRIRSGREVARIDRFESWEDARQVTAVALDSLGSAVAGGVSNVSSTMQRSSRRVTRSRSWPRERRLDG